MPSARHPRSHWGGGVDPRVGEVDCASQTPCQSTDPPSESCDPGRPSRQLCGCPGGCQGWPGCWSSDPHRRGRAEQSAARRASPAGAEGCLKGA
eukprot:364939-Chlamydomonas_euryale.AAC.7